MPTIATVCNVHAMPLKTAYASVWQNTSQAPWLWWQIYRIATGSIRNTCRDNMHPGHTTLWIVWQVLFHLKKLKECRIVSIKPPLWQQARSLPVQNPAQKSNSWLYDSVSIELDTILLAVLACGGVGNVPSDGGILTTCEIFDGTRWSAGPSLLSANANFKMILLQSNVVIYLGAAGAGRAHSATWTPGSGSWTGVSSSQNVDSRTFFTLNAV